MAAKIWINGCFDGLHEGHKRLFEEASVLGDIYIGLNSDSSISRLKGKGRPFHSYESRSQSIFRLLFVERLVKIDTEEQICDYINEFKIDYIMKGADTLYDKKYKTITGQKLVKAVLYIDHGNLSIHSSDRGPAGVRG